MHKIFKKFRKYISILFLLVLQIVLFSCPINAAISDQNYSKLIENKYEAKADSAAQINCHCSKIMQLKYFYDHGIVDTNSISPDSVWIYLFKNKTFPWKPGSSFAAVGKLCSHIWNGTDISIAEDFEATGYKYGATYAAIKLEFTENALQQKNRRIVTAKSVQNAIDALSNGKNACIPSSTTLDTCEDYLDTCACKQLKALSTQWEALSPMNKPSFNLFYTSKTGKIINVLYSAETMLNICESIWKTGAGEDANGKPLPWTSSAAGWWRETAQENLQVEALQQELKVPCLITCYSCNGDSFGVKIPHKLCYPQIPDCKVMQGHLMSFLKHYPNPIFSSWHKMDTTFAIGKMLQTYMEYQDAMDANDIFNHDKLQLLTAFRNYLDSLYNVCPQQHFKYDISYYLNRFLFCSFTTSTCDSCVTINDNYLSAIKNTLGSISAKREEFMQAGSNYSPNSHQLHSNNWLLLNSPRDIKEFYQSPWYAGNNFENELRYIHLKYVLPDMRVQVKDQQGYDFRFEIDFDRPLEYYSFQNIYSVESIKPFVVNNCNNGNYFEAIVYVVLPKKYCDSVQNKVCRANNISNVPLFCLTKVKMTGRIIKPKVKCVQKIPSTGNIICAN